MRRRRYLGVEGVIPEQTGRTSYRERRGRAFRTQAKMRCGAPKTSDQVRAVNCPARNGYPAYVNRPEAAFITAFPAIPNFRMTARCLLCL